MHLRKFNQFADAIARIPNAWPRALRVDVSRFFDGAWYSVNGTKLSAVPREFSDSLNQSQTVKLKGKNACVVPCKEIGAVAVFEFPNSPNASTRSQAELQISKTLEAELYKYDAHHDSLTGCPNRKAFERRYSEAADEMARPASPTSKSVSASSGRRVWLVALDIDHFKRLNDRHGHAYGDLALAAFAMVVDQECEAAAKSGFIASLFRLGGEEFLILLVGEVSEREARDFAERLRSRVEEAIIPSAAHIEILSRDSPLGFEPPLEKERTITTSIGVVQLDEADLRANRGKALSVAKSRADRALYYAKAGGRNCVRIFTDILKEHGSVLFFDKRVKVVGIDLGSQVGGEKGQEFFVVPKLFSGKAPFEVDDGRSVRRLGTVPRRHAAVITIFDSQAEMSFCTVKEILPDYEVQPQDLLELISLGAYGGLSASGATGSVPEDSAALAAILSALKSRARNSSVAFECIVASNIEEFAREHGVGVANDLLASMRTTVMSTQQEAVSVVFLGLGVLIVALSAEDQEVASAKASQLADVLVGLDDRADFRVGVYFRAWDDSQPFAEDIVRLSVARAEAAAKRARSGVAALFGAQLSDSVSQELYVQGKFDAVQALYEEMSALGLKSQHTSNNSAIVLFNNDNFREALARFNEALSLGEDDVIRVNIATTLARLGEFEESVKLFDLVFEGANGAEFSIQSGRPYAFAKYGQWRSHRRPEDVPGLIALLEQALTTSPEHSGFDETKLNAALHELRGF